LASLPIAVATGFVAVKGASRACSPKGIDMNNGRRKELEKASALIEDAKGIIESCRDEEQDYLDAMPESLQSSDKYSTAEQAISEMDSAIDGLETALSNIGVIIMDDQLKFFLIQGPTSVKELARLTGKSTSTLYKSLKADGVITTDSDKGKLFSMAADTVQDGQETAPASQSTPTPSKPAADAPAASTEAGKRGRKASTLGKQLTATTQDNPRRKASHGFKSLQIIIDNPGILTEDYLAKGGRLNDLNWDIAHGTVKVEG